MLPAHPHTLAWLSMRAAISWLVISAVSSPSSSATLVPKVAAMELRSRAAKGMVYCSSGGREGGRREGGREERRRVAHFSRDIVHTAEEAGSEGRAAEGGACQ